MNPLDVECTRCGALENVRCGTVLGLLFPGMFFCRERRVRAAAHQP